MPQTDSRNFSFYGWKIVSVAFFVDFMAVGFFFYSYGVFFKALAADFGGSRLDVAIGITLANLVGAIIAPFVGKALDNFPIRNIICLGAVTTSAGFFLLSLIQNQWQFYLVLATLIGVGANTMGGLSTAKLVANWFVKRRGMALGVATMGISLSGVIMPIASAALIQTVGWRNGFLVFSVLTLVLVIPIVLAFVRNKPEDIGLQPDGAFAFANNNQVVAAVKTWSTSEILKERNFWSIVVTFGFMFCCMSATLTHMVPRVSDMGFSLSEAAPVLSFCAAAGVLGKIVYGWICDFWNPKYAIATALVVQIAGQLLLLDAGNYWQLVAGASLFGFGMGGAVPLHGAIVGTHFGREGFGSVMGLMRPAMIPLQMVGIPLAGWIYDYSGSYQLAFQIFLGCYVASMLAVFSIRLKN